MLDQARTTLPEKRYQLKGNEPILLDDPQIIWLVKSGSMALFAVTIENGTVAGTRRYLFSCSPGEAMFGGVQQSDQISSHPQRQILAVPMGETELLRVDSKHLSRRVAEADVEVMTWVENWVRQLETTLTSITQPVIQVRADAPARFSLNQGQTLQPQPGTIAWVQIRQGQAHWMGFPELTLTPSTGVLPFSDNLWLTAADAVQLATESTATLGNSELLQGLSQLQVYLLHCLELLGQQETEAELQRLQLRQRLNQQVTAEALGELASPLRSSDAVFLPEGAPLLIAVGAVGRALGVTIRPPAQSEDLNRLKDPLAAIVRASRLRLRQVLLRETWWNKDCGPLIAFTQQNQPVALLPLSATHYELFDPVTQTRTPIDAHTASMLRPTAYTFYRPLPDKALNALNLLRFGLRGRFKDLLTILLAGIAAALLGMLTPQATAILIDNAIPDSDRGLLLQVGLGLFVAALGTALFRLTQGFALLRVETASEFSTQTAVWDRLLNLPACFFRQYTTGDLQSRVSSISTARRQLSGTTLNTLLTSLFALLNLGLLLYYSIKLALVAVAMALITIVVTTVCGIFIIRKTRPLLELQGHIFGQTVQLINGISKLRTAGAEERAFAAWSKNYSRQVKLILSTQFVEDLVVVFNTIMPTLTSGVLFWFAIKLLTEAQQSGNPALTIGTFLGFNTAFGTFIKGATDMSTTITNALQVVPQWKRAQPILKALPEVDLSKADPGRLVGRIEVNHVTFRYRNEGPLTLDDVTITAEPGEFIALVGGSGSGKSTLLRLLLKFETPESGTINYDGQDLAGLDVDAVRRQLGVVLQTSQIMSASIFDNITSGAPITLDEAWQAARMAGFAEDITAMPMGMHTVISEGGGNLSGGQRQRLLIARALAQKPRILLFDEATSSLDNRTQAIVSQSLDQLQVTRVVIAHRLSTIRNADCIYVLDAGRVVQQGSFEDLANQAGLFAQLMERQMA